MITTDSIEALPHHHPYRFRVKCECGWVDFAQDAVAAKFMGDEHKKTHGLPKDTPPKKMVDFQESLDKMSKYFKVEDEGLKRAVVELKQACRSLALVHHQQQEQINDLSRRLVAVENETVREQ